MHKKAKNQAPRGPAKRMTSEDAKLPIYKIDVDGDPVEPIENRRKYISQAGVIVRDEVRISIAESVSYTHLTLPTNREV